MCKIFSRGVAPRTPQGRAETIDICTENEKAPGKRGLKGDARMNASKSASMITLYFSTGQGKNHYTVTSVNTLLANLAKFHKIKIKRRWCFACLHWLINNGYIKRKQRYVQDHNGIITQIPSMINFTLKGIVWLSIKGVVGAKEIYKSMVKWLNKDEKRFPNRKDFNDGSYKPATPEDRKRLNDLLASVGKKIE